MMSSERNISELKRQIKEADARREEALSKQTDMSIQMQSLKINVNKH